MSPEAERHIELRRGEYLVSGDPARFDRAAIHAALATSYWAAGVPRDVIDRALDHSLGVGVYHEPEGPGGPAVQVGLVRVVTDRATFAWVCDVYVLPEHQGHGLGKWLMETVRDHPELQGLRRWMLGTRDAHGLYSLYGFRLLDETEKQRYMVIRDPAPYGTPSG